MPRSFAVSAKTLRKVLALSTTIVCENPKRNQIFMMALAKASAVDSAVSSQMANEVMPQAAIR